LDLLDIIFLQVSGSWKLLQYSVYEIFFNV